MGFFADPQKGLVPIGGGFFATPDTPADPRDCNRFPNSPWCGGRFLDRRGLGVVPQIVVDQCNIGVQLNPTLGFISLPSIQITYRSTSPICQPRQPQQPQEIPFPDTPDNYCEVCKCKDGTVISTVIAKDESLNGSGELFFEANTDAQIVANSWAAACAETARTYSTGLPTFVKNVKVTSGSYSGGFQSQTSGLPVFKIAKTIADTVTIEDDVFTTEDSPPTRYSVYRGNIEFSQNAFYLEYDYPNDSADEESAYTGTYYHVKQQIGTWYTTKFKVLPCEIVPDPPPPPPPPHMECCPGQQNNDQLLKLILKRIGDLPATVPDNLASEKPTPVTLQSLAEMVIWHVKQMDTLSGSYPIPISIKADPTDKNSKDQQLSLPNQAETLAEILGLLIVAKRDTHATLIATIKAMGEAAMTKNLASQTLDVALANAEFLGYKLEQKTKTIPVLFTPGGKNIATTLQETNMDIISYNNADKTDLQDDLKTLLTMASRWNAQNWRSLGKDALASLKNNFIDQPQAVINTNSAIKEESFAQFITEVQQGFTKATGVTDNTDPWGAPVTEAPIVQEVGTVPTPAENAGQQQTEDQQKKSVQQGAIKEIGTLLKSL